MGLGMRRIERERLFPMGLAMIEAGELMEGVGEVHMSRGGFGRERYFWAFVVALVLFASVMTCRKTSIASWYSPRAQSIVPTP